MENVALVQLEASRHGGNYRYIPGAYVQEKQPENFPNVHSHADV
jgi:hypothetical protein